MTRSASGDSGSALVLVTVGSDHHPFDRLIGWVEDWLAHVEPDNPVRCVMQYGTSAAPVLAEGHEFLDHDELQYLMARATVIVTQGGPMSIVEARRAGRVPIAVPRDPALGEHVDGHQQIFTRRMLAEGHVYMPDSAPELAALLDKALESPASFDAAEDVQETARVRDTAAKISHLVDALVHNPVQARPLVLLIVGVGRSGSTLFERAIGDVPGVFALGETVHLWERGVRDDELCGCEQPFSTCPFWQAVGHRAFNGWDKVDVDDVIALRHAVIRTRYAPALLRTTLRVGWRLKRDRLARLLTAFYAAVAAEAGSDHILVDSSKMPAYAALLTRADVDLRCVQVVRDPRGVAYSWSKTVVRPEVTDGSAEMPRYAAAESALWWSVFDVLVRRIRRRGVPVTTVRYEDFVSDPRACVESVLQFCGRAPSRSDLGHLHDRDIVLRRHHLVAGNPMRFTSGHVSLTPDEEWRDDLPARDRRLVSALTFALRRRYGYLGR